jgi:hypothetical protein
MNESKADPNAGEPIPAEAIPEPEGPPEDIEDKGAEASPPPVAGIASEPSAVLAEVAAAALPVNGDGTDAFEAIGPLTAPSRVERPSDARGRSVLEGPVGLDIGTAHIVVAVTQEKQVMVSLQRNAFYAIPATPLTRDAFQRDKVLYFEKDSKVYVLGHSAEDFAGICRDVSRRPVENGMLNAREDDSETILKALISRMVRRSHLFQRAGRGFGPARFLAGLSRVDHQGAPGRSGVPPSGRERGHGRGAVRAVRE